MMKTTHLIAFADNLVIVAAAKIPKELKEKADRSFRTVEKKLKQIKLSLAKNKTKIIILTGQEVNKESIKYIKYFEIHRDMKMTTYIRKTYEKAEKLKTSMKDKSNVGSSTQLSRKVKSSTGYTSLLYGAAT